MNIDALSPEKRRLLEMLHQRPTVCVPQLFERQAARLPEALACTGSGRSLSYAALNERANRLAHRLRAEGVQPEVRVALFMDRSPDFLAGLLAIFKAGGVYVPVDPNYPAAYVQRILDASKPSVVVCAGTLMSRLGDRDGAGPRVLDIDAFFDPQVADGATAQPATDLPACLRPEHLASISYTSGSTGRPKGVMIEHRQVLNWLHALWARMPFAPGEMVGQKTSCAFVVSLKELLAGLLAGTPQVLIPDRVVKDADAFLAQLSEHRVTRLNIVPSQLRTLIDHAGDRPEDSPLATLKHCMVSGEPFTQRLRQEFLRKFPQVTLWNVYGCTELNDTTYCRPDEQEHDGVFVPIGRAIANTRAYVLDANLDPVPPGLPGELCVESIGIARGYFDQPDVTASRFVPHPYSDVPGARLFRTGDIVRQLDNGSFDFLGREDFEVKIRGNRLDVRQVEAVLAEMPEVQESCVMARQDRSEDPQLVAYVVPRPNHEGTDGQASLAPSFSLLYFGADTFDEAHKYAFYLSSAKFADDNGFEAVWTPERHFHAFGALYPSPAVLTAALATITTRVQLRAGSVVLPLGHPVRVAEEWSVIDNLSQGRVGVAIASGWNPRDFVLAPHNFPPPARLKHLREGIATLRALWEGESITLPDGTGQPLAVTIQPRPLQRKLPLWLAAAANPETFAYAGEIGANVATHFLGLTLEELTDRIALYRDSLARHGHDPAAFRVTLMVHTFLGTDHDATVAAAKGPFVNYIRHHLNLREAFMKSMDLSVEDFGDQALDRIAEHAFERYTRTASFIGTPRSCAPLVRQLKARGVDELACLVDWMPPQHAETGLPHLLRLRELAQSPEPDAVAVQAHCANRLPSFMSPAVVVFLDQMPRTPNGKLDRKALPVPEAGGQAGIVHVAPRTPDEQALATIWSELLGVPAGRIGVHDDFFALGGHSLSLVSLIARVQRELQATLPIEDVFTHPTIEQQAQLIGRHASPRERLALDLRAEATLDEAIRPPVDAPPPSLVPRRAFLTGATGFLGIHLLHTLLRETDAHIVCLVRAASADDALARLQQGLAAQGLQAGRLQERVTPVLGDLGQPRFGLSPERHAALAREVDCIYHSGATVNFIYPYSVLKATNVLGTQEVLRLACTARLKPVHHISTVGTYSAFPHARPILESDDPLHHVPTAADGYAQSKWVAEALVREAQARGVPVTIHRPGLIVGPDATGISAERDFVWAWLKGCVQLGQVPALPADAAVHMTPVDDIARAIVTLSQRRDSLGRAFQLIHPDPARASALLRSLGAAGYALEEVSYGDWSRALHANAQQGIPNAIDPHLALFPVQAQAALPHAGLYGESSVQPPRLTDEVLARHIAHLQRTGYLPAMPARQVTPA